MTLKSRDLIANETTDNGADGLYAIGQCSVHRCLACCRRVSAYCCINPAPPSSRSISSHSCPVEILLQSRTVMRPYSGDSYDSSASCGGGKRKVWVCIACYGLRRSNAVSRSANGFTCTPHVSPPYLFQNFILGPEVSPLSLLSSIDGRGLLLGCSTAFAPLCAL